MGGPGEERTGQGEYKGWSMLGRIRGGHGGDKGRARGGHGEGTGKTKGGHGKDKGKGQGGDKSRVRAAGWRVYVGRRVGYRWRVSGCPSRPFARIRVFVIPRPENATCQPDKAPQSMPAISL